MTVLHQVLKLEYLLWFLLLVSRVVLGSSLRSRLAEAQSAEWCSKHGLATSCAFYDRGVLFATVNQLSTSDEQGQRQALSASTTNLRMEVNTFEVLTKGSNALIFLLLTERSW